MNPNGFINSVTELVPNFEIFWGKPTSDAFGLEVGMEAVGKVLILSGVADEEGIVFDGGADQRFGVSDERLRHATAAQEEFGDLAVTLIDSVNADG